MGKIAEKSLNVSQLTELITNGRTETIRGLSPRPGKFDACLCMEKDENGKTVIKFDFEHVEAKVKDVVCPLCGGEIVQTPFDSDVRIIRKMIRKAAASPLEKWQRNH